MALLQADATLKDKAFLGLRTEKNLAKAQSSPNPHHLEQRMQTRRAAAEVLARQHKRHTLYSVVAEIRESRTEAAVRNQIADAFEEKDAKMQRLPKAGAREILLKDRPKDWRRPTSRRT